MKTTSYLIVALLLALSGVASGQTQYGDAEIHQGSLTIVRDGYEHVYGRQDGSVAVILGDVLRVGEDSLVVLKTIEATELSMGSHAVFQVAPWQQRNRTGYARMVYGKMTFTTERTEGRRPFRVKTASATIGVKGTGGDCEVGSSGNTGCVGKTGVIEFRGVAGPAQDLTPSYLAMAVGNKPVPQTVAVPIERRESDVSLDKVPPTAAASVSIEQEDHAVAMGMIDSQDLEESQQDEIPADSAFDQEMAQAEQDRALDAGEAVETDEAFDQQLEQNQNQYEEMTIEADIPVVDVAAIDVGPVMTQPDIPVVDVSGAVEEAVQVGKDATGRLILNFDK